MLIHGSPDALHPVTLGGLSAAVSDADIANYISNVLNTVGLTDEQKAAQIADAAEQYGVSVQDISRSTGYSVAEVTDYLSLATQQAQTTTTVESVTQPVNEPYYAPIVSTVTVEPEKNTSSGVSFSEVKRVLDYYLTDPRVDDQHRAYVVAGYMRDKKISVDEIAEIMGYSPVDVTNYLAIAYQPPSFDDSVSQVVKTTVQTQQTAAAAAAAATAAAAKVKAAQAAQAAAAATAAAVAKAKATAAAAEAAAKAKAAATGSTLQTQVTTSQTGVSSALPLILAAAAAYFLGA